MSKINGILFPAYCSPNEAAYQETENYLQRFADVDLRSAAKDLPPFPDSLKGLDLDLLMQGQQIIDQAFSRALLEASELSLRTWPYLFNRDPLK